jgi:hypothetical protein
MTNSNKFCLSAGALVLVLLYVSPMLPLNWCCCCWWCWWWWYCCCCFGWLLAAAGCVWCGWQSLQLSGLRVLSSLAAGAAEGEVRALDLMPTQLLDQLLLLIQSRASAEQVRLS